jgi:hypothetical protein
MASHRRRVASTDLLSHTQDTVLWTRLMRMSTRWVCDSCAYVGRNVDDVASRSNPVPDVRRASDAFAIAYGAR